MKRSLGLALGLWLATGAAWGQSPPNFGSQLTPNAPPGASNLANAAINGLTMGLRQDAAQTGSGGSAYALQDILTVSGGVCTTNPTLVVWSAGAAPIVSVRNPGKCSVIPSDPVSVTGGSGTGATFSFAGLWGPAASDVPSAAFIASGPNGPVLYPPALAVGVLNPSIGNQCFGNPGACGGGGNTNDGMGGGTGMSAAGNENTFMGYLTGAQVTTGNFLAAFGHHAFGHAVGDAFGVAIGTDAAKWTTGSSGLVAVGSNAAKFQLNPSGVVAIGSGAGIGGQFLATVSGAVSNGGLCEVTVNSTTGMVTGDTAVVTGVLGATGCNGVITNVTVTDGTHLTLPGTTFGGVYTSGGAVADYGSVALTGSVLIGTSAGGSSALRSTGSIVAIGSGAANALTTGNNDTVIGLNAGSGLLGGSTDTFIGSGAGVAVTAGSGGVAVGSSANPSQNAGSFVIVGAAARGGANGVYIGNSVGSASLTGANNTCIGFSVCKVTLTTGTSNLLAGVNNNVDTAANNTTHALVIGTQASLTAASNAMNIEGIITATGTGTASTSTTTIAGQLAVAAMTQTSAAQTGTVCYNSGTGAITYDATLGCLTSTLEAKNDWIDMVPEQALAIVKQLRPGTYTYKLGLGLPDGPQVGFAAEQVALVDDRLVGYRPDGTVGGVRYQQASALYAGAIRALQDEIDELKRKTAWIDALQPYAPHSPFAPLPTWQ